MRAEVWASLLLVALFNCVQCGRLRRYRPVLKLISQTGPVISEEETHRLAGQGFEGGRVVKDDHGRYWLFTAEFQGWPTNANMRIAIWRADLAAGPWQRQSTIAASKGDGTSVETWARTCRADNLEASPWAPFPLFSEEEDRWHVLWVSYSCDLSWVVRVGQGNIFGAVSTKPGRDGIGGPYASYGAILGPSASGPSATRWGDLSACSPCHVAGGVRPPFCDSPPCRYDNSKTGAAISIGPYPLNISATARYVAFVGLEHDFASAPSPRGPWTIYTAAQMGESFFVKMATPSSPYAENPVVTEITQPDGQKGHIAVFDTVSPSGGWAWEGGKWISSQRGEWYGFGMSYSRGGAVWSEGEDVAVAGGVRTPLGLIEEADGTYTMFFTRRFPDCENKVLAFGSRGDAANGRSMCALLYAAKFEVRWDSSQPDAPKRLLKGEWDLESPAGKIVAGLKKWGNGTAPAGIYASSNTSSAGF